MQLSYLVQLIENYKKAQADYNEAYELCEQEMFRKKYVELHGMDEDKAYEIASNWARANLHKARYYQRYLKCKQEYEELAYLEIGGK